MTTAPGYIAASSLDSDTVDTLLYGPQATDHTYDAAREEAEIAASELGLTGNDLDRYIEQRLEDTYPDEPEISGTYEGVTYRTSYLGGALNFWIIDSPHTTAKGRPCSPCLLPASTVILDTLDGHSTGFDVPAHWRAVTPD